MCVSSPTRSLDASSAGGSLPTCVPPWCSTPSRWPWARGTRLEGLVTHSDAGSQFTSIRYGERLAELGAVPSIGSVGDSFDNALAETVNGLYKTELIRGPDQGPWRTIDDVELATLGWVHWYNTERLHGYLDDVPPVEYEEAHYAQTATSGSIGNQ